ncbi:MAG: signal peptidase I [Eubacteriales bacterium]|nr:signal peptidase I [Eubacteriales bacterium]
MEEKNWKEQNPLVQVKEKIESNKKVRNFLRLLFELAVTLAFAALFAIGMFQSVTMQESAMEPTLSVGDRFFINKVVYKFQEPKRGDIIVFKTSLSDDAAWHIQRVIGLPGETIQIVEGKVRINGTDLEESYPEITNPGSAQTAVSLQAGEYFVLGDNRNNSEDSRYSDVGLIRKKYIIGKLWFVLSPGEKRGFLKG